MSAQGLPAHILALFTPRPPPQHLPPQIKKKNIKLTGCADFVDFLPTETPPKREAWESPLERKARRHREKLEKHKDELKKIAADYDPHKDSNAVGDPFKTLFVARISFDTTEKKLKREFEVFGSIKRVRMVYDQKGKPRGYAFIEYEHERDLKNAYKQGDGKKIDGRRVMVDVERGRTVEGWMPRRLGGGRGPGRQGKPSKKKAKRLAAEAKEKDKEENKDEKRGDRERDRDRDRERDRNPREREVEKEKEPERERRREKDDEREKRKEKDEEKEPKEPKEPKEEKKKDKERSKDKDKEKDKEKDKDKKAEASGGAKDKKAEASGGAKEKTKEKDRDRKRSRERSRSRDRKAKKTRD